jgi:hypothetical protein
VLCSIAILLEITANFYAGHKGADPTANTGQANRQIVNAMRTTNAVEAVKAEFTHKQGDWRRGGRAGKGGVNGGAIIFDSSRPTTKILQPFFNSSELCQIKSE